MIMGESGCLNCKMGLDGFCGFRVFSVDDPLKQNRSFKTGIRADYGRFLLRDGLVNVIEKGVMTRRAFTKTPYFRSRTFDSGLIMGESPESGLYPCMIEECNFRACSERSLAISRHTLPDRSFGLVLNVLGL